MGCVQPLHTTGRWAPFLVESDPVSGESKVVAPEKLVFSDTAEGAIQTGFELAEAIESNRT